MNYAHSLENQPQEKWQSLEEHATQVASRAAGFANSFVSGEWANLAGLLHDLGKARKSFQDYLKRSNGLLDTGYDASDHSHSGAGAAFAEEKFPKLELIRTSLSGMSV